MSIDPNSPRQASPNDLLAWPVGLRVVATFGLIWVSLGELGMTWDEPYFYGNSTRSAGGLARCWQPGRPFAP